METLPNRIRLTSADAIGITSCVLGTKLGWVGEAVGYSKIASTLKAPIRVITSWRLIGVLGRASGSLLEDSFGCLLGDVFGFDSSACIDLMYSSGYIDATD